MNVTRAYLGCFECLYRTVDSCSKSSKGLALFVLSDVSREILFPIYSYLFSWVVLDPRIELRFIPIKFNFVRISLSSQHNKNLYNLDFFIEISFRKLDEQELCIFI